MSTINIVLLTQSMPQAVQLLNMNAFKADEYDVIRIPTDENKCICSTWDIANSTNKWNIRRKFGKFNPAKPLITKPHPFY